MSISINPFESDPSVIGVNNQFGTAGAASSSGIGDTENNFDSFLSSEVSGLQGTIDMAMDKLSSPLKTIQPILDKINSGQPIANTKSISDELFRVAQELLTSIEAAPQPDENLLRGLGHLTAGLTSLVEEHGSEGALENLTMLYAQFDVNTYGHNQLKVRFIHWTRIEIFSLDSEKKKDANFSPSKGLNITQKLQSQLAGFVESIKDQDIAAPLLPFFGTSRFIESAMENFQNIFNNANITEKTDNGIASTTSEESDSSIIDSEEGDSFQEVAESINSNESA
jgi:hypothetical protein